MAAILSVTAVCAFLGYSVWTYMLTPALSRKTRGDNNAIYIIGILVASFIIHVICAVTYKGHNTDMSCFTAWSDMIFNDGIGKFYSSDTFHDYPPGYMYVLYLIGAIKHLFNPTEGGLYLLVKFPAIVCDLLTGFFIYLMAKKKFSDGISSIISALYLLNPAVILNSSLWGQVDSVYTLAIAVMVYLISNKKMIASYFVFAICIFIKPQAFIFTPLIIYGIIENVFMPKFDSQRFFKNLGLGLCAIALIFILALPFGIGNVITQYKATLASYPYLTVNAFNIWGALGKNWTGLTPATTVVGYVILVLIVVYATYVFFKSKSSSKYYFVGAILSFATFMLSTKMHDRYAFPTMVLLLMVFIETQNVKSYWLYIFSMLTQFFNTAWVLFIYEQDINKYFQSPVIRVASVINIIFFVYTIWIAQKNYVKNNALAAVGADKKTEKVTAKKQSVNNKTAKDAAPLVKTSKTFSISEIFSKITKFDIIAMLIITVVYSGFALYDLGDMAAPETETLVSDGAVQIDLGKDVSIGRVRFYLGSNQLDETRPLNMEFKNSHNQVVKNDSMTSGAVFYWSEEIEDVTARYITLSTTGDRLSIKEFCVVDLNGNKVMPTNTSDPKVMNMFDEQELIPQRQSFRNSTYFDEIYHGRTAYEFIHHLTVYEWTHPPLGKLIIAIGILIFGMNPFGWRIAGTVIGIFMIPVIYLFAKRLLKYRWLSIVTCVLFTFDFMHFAQTRISTIDVYITFFIILMYYFMYKYYRLSFYDTPFKKTLIPLLCSGICMGLGIASKWTGVYAGCGLAIIFFYTLYQRYDEYRYAVKNPKGETSGIKHSYIIKNFKPYMLKTLGWCCIFFVAIPLVIYILSYIPYMMTPSGHGLATITENAQSMLAYHNKTVLGATHPFSSKWYEWPIMKRPIWYYSGTVSDGVKEGISAFGNPLVWWAGIPAFIYMLYLSFVKKDKKSIFLAIGYAAQLVPWIPISRLTFIYHYFPCVPFIVLMIGYAIYDIYRNAKNKKAVIYGTFVYGGLAVVLFLMFYPVLSGQPCSTSYAETWLKWFSSWILL